MDGGRAPSVRALVVDERTDVAALIWAARACYLEAAFVRADCIAISWVGRKRAPLLGPDVDWIEAVRRYSALRANNARARWIRALPWGYVPERSAGWNARWLELRALVLELEAGLHPDPCPTAMHWGGRTDVPTARMVAVRCDLPTVNTFYAVRRR